MSLYTVQFSPLAETDLAEIWFQIAEHNFYAANDLIDAIKMRANKLSSEPLRHHHIIHAHIIRSPPFIG